MSPDFYNKHHLINITKDYKIINENLVDVVNKEAAVIAAKLDIENKVEVMSKTETFISIKDHKNDFENNPKFRLINPAKSQIGLGAATGDKTKLTRYVSQVHSLSIKVGGRISSGGLATLATLTQ